MCLQEICPSNAAFMPHMPNTSSAYYDTPISVYMPHNELNAINNVTRSTSMHLFPITGICL